VTRDEVLQVIADVQQHKSETGDVEVKTARGGTPKRSYEALSAFANHPGGGVMLFGLDEEKDFEVVGVGDAHRLQEDISSLAADSLEPALRPAFAVELIEGKTVVAVAIPEVPPEQKPCYYKTAGLQGGSYIRVGNSNRRMTDYEIFGYVSSRKQSKFDEEIVEGATMDDLDRSKMDSYVKRLRRLRPRAPYIDRQLEQVLKQRRIVREVDSVLRPTLAGLLVFGAYPQEYEPQLVITFLQFYGTTETEKTPRGERFLDNRKFEGTIPEMVEEVVDYALASMRKSSLSRGSCGGISPSIRSRLCARPS
jgi:ATP-dependent DNA helicase RecG